MTQNIQQEKRNVAKHGENNRIEWTEFPEGALNLIFKRSLLCAKKHYKKKSEPYRHFHCNPAEE